MYFEIYCHPYRANFILQEWYKFIKGINNVIRNWFYIRYNDPSAHLRIRLQLKNTDCINEILKSVKQLVKPLLLNSYIQDFCLKTYFRETLRYQAAPIDWVEQFFNDDSQYCLALLNSEPTNDQLYRATLNYTDALLNIYSENRNKQLAFIRSMAEKFASEMKFSSQKFKRINYIYKKIDALPDYKINGSAKNSLKIVKRQFKRILSHCVTQDERENMVADLLHLHINRLFIQQQRMHETIIYQLLLNTTKKKQVLEGALVE
ncbi:thiopeptide-type bacteriocin biosynthesis domain protein [compost metagenome]